MQGWLSRELKNSKEELTADIRQLLLIDWVRRKIEASKLKRTRHKAAIARGRALRKQIDERFRDYLYIVPQEIFDDPKIKRDSVWYDENRADYWQQMLDEFPDAPRTQSEVTRNEARFWEIWVDKFTVENEYGEPDLQPHAFIDDFYRGHEKWVLRFYFAATEKLVDPWIRRYVELQLHMRVVDKWYWDNPHKSGAVSEIHRDMMHCLGPERAAHFEKWGEWFVSHIAETFRQAHTKPTQRRQQLADGGWASLADIQGKAEPEWLLPDISSWESAQSQSFED